MSSFLSPWHRTLTPYRLNIVVVVLRRSPVCKVVRNLIFEMTTTKQEKRRKRSPRTTTLALHQRPDHEIETALPFSHQLPQTYWQLPQVFVNNCPTEATKMKPTTRRLLLLLRLQSEVSHFLYNTRCFLRESTPTLRVLASENVYLTSQLFRRNPDWSPGSPSESHFSKPSSGSLPETPTLISLSFFKHLPLIHPLRLHEQHQKNRYTI